MTHAPPASLAYAGVPRRAQTQVSADDGQAEHVQPPCDLDHAPPAGAGGATASPEMVRRPPPVPHPTSIIIRRPQRIRVLRCQCHQSAGVRIMYTSNGLHHRTRVDSHYDPVNNPDEATRTLLLWNNNEGPCRRRPASHIPSLNSPATYRTRRQRTWE
eukprot:1303380-Pyramimonas_sp.AAC.1